MTETKRPVGRPKKELKPITELEKLYYSIDETAQILEVHPNTIRKLIKAGKLPAEQLGRQWRIPKTAFKSL